MTARGSACRVRELGGVALGIGCTRLGDGGGDGEEHGREAEGRNGALSLEKGLPAGGSRDRKGSVLVL